MDDTGKFIGRYGHPGSQATDILMRDGGAESKILYSVVSDFNKGHTSK